MTEVIEEIHIDRPADHVWPLLADFGRIDRWHPAIRETHLKQGLLQRENHLHPSGVSVERLNVLDDTAHTLSYSMREAPLPVRDYRARMSVEALGADQCRVRWQASFDPTDSSAEDGVRGFLRQGLQALREGEVGD